MTVSKPHFLLFSSARTQLAESAGPDDRPLNAGAQSGWRFSLESVDGQAQLDADDVETGIDRERLELLAVVRGLEALAQPSQVTLITTSRYVRRGLRFGLPEWRDNGWQWEHFGKMTAVENHDLWQRIDRALDYHDVHCRVLQDDDDHGDPRETSRARQRATAGTPRSTWWKTVSGWASRLWPSTRSFVPATS